MQQRIISNKKQFFRFFKKTFVSELNYKHTRKYQKNRYGLDYYTFNKKGVIGVWNTN